MFTLSSILAVVVVGVLPADEPTNEQVREAVQRSIPFVQEKGAWWIEKKKCVSCHRVNSMIWSLRAARRNGFEVSDNLDEWLKWATDSSLSKDDKGQVVGLGNKEGVAQIVLSLDGDADQADIRQELTALLLDEQQPDGSWKSGCGFYRKIADIYQMRKYRLVKRAALLMTNFTTVCLRTRPANRAS